LDEVDGIPMIVSSTLEIDAAVAGVDDDSFQVIVREAAELCPVSRLLPVPRCPFAPSCDHDHDSRTVGLPAL
jgi:hypothetical protein